jgi:hypothetical protein
MGWGRGPLNEGFKFGTGANVTSGKIQTLLGNFRQVNVQASISAIGQTDPIKDN